LLEFGKEVSDYQTAIGELSQTVDVEDVKAGDKVIFEKYTGTEVKDGDNSFLILDIENVLAITE